MCLYYYCPSVGNVLCLCIYAKPSVVVTAVFCEVYMEDAGMLTKEIKMLSPFLRFNIMFIIKHFRLNTWIFCLCEKINMI